MHGSGSAGLTVCLHPEDQRIVESRLAEVDDMRERLGAVNFVADAGVERGAVRVETEAGQLVYEPRDVLERISAEVRSEVRA